MKNLSLGLKITSGFALLILIAGALGVMAIWNMDKVETQSTMLAHEYVPEVAVAVEIRGAANRLMYEMRGYGFTEDKTFYTAAEKELKAVEKALEKARVLDAASPNLKALKGQLEVATKAVEDYKMLIGQTVDTNGKLAENRKTLDSSALEYMTHSNEFLAGQNEKFKIDLDERQEKIKIVSSLSQAGASTRVLNFKSQALGDPKLMEKAIATIGGVKGFTTDLRKITRSAEDINRIDATESAAKSYQSAMGQFLAEYKKGSMADNGILNDFRRDMDENAGIYVENCDAFLNGQQEMLTKDMLERHDKISLVNDIIDLGNSARIGAFKSQALRSPKVMEAALDNFPKIDKKFVELKKITRLAQDLERIDEVRNLAMRAADAAKNTAALIEGTVKKVSDGSELVSSTNDAFSKVAGSAAKVGAIVSEIVEASKEQSNGIEQVNIAITEMDKVVQQNAANAEESASASEEMNAQAEQLKEYVSELVMLVTGRANQGSTFQGHHQMKTISSKPKTARAGKNKMLAHTSKEV